MKKNITYNNLKRNFLRYQLLLLSFLFLSNISAQKIIFSDDFESGELNAAFWNAVPSISGNVGGRIELFNNSDGAYSGSFYLGLGRNSDGELTSNALDLSLDLSGQSQVQLNFYLRTYYDETEEGEGIYFSDDNGESFTQVYQFNHGEETQNIYFLSPSIDIDALAKANGLSLNENFVIRFLQIGSGDFRTIGDEDGFLIDDVVVYDPAIQYVRPPFIDGFESGKLDNMWHVSDPSNKTVNQATAPEFAPHRFGSSALVYNSSNTNSGSFHLGLGRLRDGNLTTSSLDLHLNLEGLSEVELRFFLRSYYDQSEEEEGLYFSDDGGATFTQVYRFNQGEETQNVYLYSPNLDVDALATANGLSLTSNFIIRFQQIGSGNFTTRGDEDGFIIDDVSVFVPESEYASLPFFDGFETGDLGPMWEEANGSESAMGQPTAPSFAPTRFGGMINISNSTNSNSGSFQLAVGREVDGVETSTALDLKLNLEGQSNVELRFYLRSYYDEMQDQEGLYFSDDGGKSFVQVYKFNQDLIKQNVYQMSPNIDVDNLAAANGLSLTSNFVIRFQQIGSGNLNTRGDEDGFLIDDVSVFVPKIEYVSLPFEDDFESGTWGPMWGSPNPSEPANGQPTAPEFAPTLFGSLVTLFNRNGIAHNGTFYAGIGRAVDGNQTTSVLDLRLNLEGESNVELRFFWTDYYDETQQQEGIYFSDDSGKTFVQVTSFDPTQNSNLVYSEQVVDVSSLAKANELDLTASFVIRFQQIGSGNFNTSGNEDGFFIDDVSVTSGRVTSAKQLFDDGNKLLQNFPNPAENTTVIPFYLSKHANVKLRLIDLQGRVAAILHEGRFPAGNQSIQVELKDVAKGMYIYELSLNENIQLRKSLIIE